MFPDDRHGGAQTTLPPAFADAVRRYCGQLCSPKDAEGAAEQILASATATTSADALKRITRSVAAQYALGGPPRHGWRGLLAAEHDDACAHVPAQLAAQANGELSSTEANELERHLRDCPLCREIEQRAGRAEEAFALESTASSAERWLVEGQQSAPQETTTPQAIDSGSAGARTAWLLPGDAQAESTPGTGRAPEGAARAGARAAWLVTSDAQAESAPPMDPSTTALPVAAAEPAAEPGDATAAEPAGAPGDIRSVEPAGAPGDIRSVEPAVAPGDATAVEAAVAAGDTTPTAPARRRKIAAAIIVTALLAAVAVAGVLSQNSGSGPRPLPSRASSSSPTPALATSTPTRSVPVKKRVAPGHHARRPAKRVVHRTVAPATSASPQVPSPASSSTTPATSPTVTPVTPAPTAPPQPAGGRSGGGTGSAPATAIVQGGSLPAQPAPTQGIGKTP